MIRRLVSLATVAVLTVGTTVASASPITFIGLDNPRGTLTNTLAAEAQFKAALSVFGTENVDTISNGTVNPTLVFGATGVTAIAGNTAALPASYAVSAPNVLFDRPSDDVFTFNQLVQGFGTFLISFADFPGTDTLTFKLENTILGTSQTVTVGTFGDLDMTSVLYFGVLDAASPFNRVTVHEVFDGDAFEYDNLTAGFAPASAVPEPASLVLLATGAVGLLARRRRQRRSPE